MDKTELLEKLEQLLPKNGLGTRQNGIEWAAKVRALLKFHPHQELYNTFSTAAHSFSHQLYGTAHADAYYVMKSQLITAVESLKIEIDEEKNLSGKFFPTNSQLLLQSTMSKLLGLANSKL